MTRPRLVLLLSLLNLVRWARSTRPGELPPPPRGSREVVTHDGTRLHVQVGGREGAELTVVFVHGLLARSIEFDQQWAALSGRARLVRYDHRNHGRSSHSGRAVHLDQLADDLLAVLTHVAPQGPLVIVGHSMGGITTLALALRHPEVFSERVAGVALIGAAAGHDLADHPGENRVRELARRQGLAGGFLALRLLAPALEGIRPRRTHTMRLLTRRLVFGGADADPATLAMTQALLEEPPLVTLAALQGALLRTYVQPALAALGEMPVLVLTGSDDRLVRPDHSRRIAAELGESAELVEVPGAGHVVNQTRPAEVNAALHRLLDRVAQGGADGPHHRGMDAGARGTTTS